MKHDSIYMRFQTRKYRVRKQIGVYLGQGLIASSKLYSLGEYPLENNEDVLELYSIHSSTSCECSYQKITDVACIHFYWTDLIQE